ncbi:hypothetical protein [Methanobrevibacter sp.]|uniref:hypothetical protein n=1 Tax=Methanobrevibacter sp. TaxID=66852 RepID=UPI0038663C75
MMHDNAGRVCSNCRYWVVDVQLRGSADGVICTMGQGHTKPSDTCPLFLQDIAVHNIKNQK